MIKKITVLFIFFLAGFFAKAQIKAYEYHSEDFNETKIIEILDASKKSGTQDWELQKLKTHLYQRLENQRRRLAGGNLKTTTPVSPMVINGPCTNIGFENGSTSGWTLTSGNINGTTLPCNTCATTAGGIATITSATNSGTTWTAGVDNCSGQPVVAPGGGVNSVCLNNNTSGGKMQEIQQTFLVSTSNNIFTYQYLAVLEDGGHAATDQPYFFSQVTDGSGNVIACTKVLQSASGTISGWTNSASCPSTSYKGWVTVTLDLTTYIGQNVTIQILVSDCNQGGHFGYCYLDANCDQEATTNAVTICPGTTQLCGQAGYTTYAWTGPVTGNAMCLNTGTPGSYTLTCTGQCPAPIRYYNVTVSPTPTVNFSSTVTPCNQTVPFTDMTTISGGATITNWAWNFGDAASGASNTSTTQNPSHTYSGVGTFNVVLTCTSSAGCSGTYSASVTIGTGPTAAFSATTVCPGNPTVFTNTSTGATSYSWNFGEPSSGAANTSTSPNPSHTYATGGSYTVVLSAMGTGTCVATKSLTVIVNPVPTATISAPPVCLGAATVFSSTINPTAGTTYMWNYGDGAPVAGTATPTHTYGTASTFPVTVTVTAVGGCSVTATTNAIVNPLPTAAFSVAQVCQGTGSTFNNTSTGANTCAWNFGGAGNPATASTNCSPTYTYSGSGTFPVTLTITAVGGCTATATGSAVVNPMPVLSITTTSVCDLTPVTVTNNTAAQATFTVWAWDFGDGIGTSTAANPGTYTYPAPGVYTITLTASTNTGCSGTVTTVTNVHPNPDFNGTFTQPCFGDASSIYDASTVTNPPGLNDAITAWNWDFGDGYTTATSVDSANHTYSTCGSYTLSYTVTTNFNCSASASAPDTVFCLPVVTAPPNITTCPNSPVANSVFTTTVSNGGPAYSYWEAFSVHSGMPPADSTLGGYDVVPGFTSSVANNTCGNLIDTVAAIAISNEGCFGNVDFYTVTLYPTPTVTPTSDISVCSNQQVNIPGFTGCPASETFNWTTSGDNIGLPPSPGSGNIAPFNGVNSTFPIASVAQVNVTPTANGCFGTPSSFNITVSPLPVINSITSFTVCPGDQIPSPTINTTPAGGVSLTWTASNNTNIGMPASGTGIPLGYAAPINSSLINQIGYVTYIPTYNGCVGLPNNDTINIKPTPFIQSIPDQSWCPSFTTTPVTFVTSPTGSTYNWSYNTGSGVPSTGTSNPFPGLPTSNPGLTTLVTAVTVTPTLNGCVGLPGGFNIFVFPNPVPKFTYTPGVCEGQAMSFTDLSTPNSGSITVNQWGWDMNNDGIYNESTAQNPQYTVMPAGLNTIGLVVSTNSNPSCFAKISETVYVNPNPVADFVADILSGCPKLPVNFTDQSSLTLNGTAVPAITSWSWTFGNGNTSNSPMPPQQVYNNTSPLTIASYTVSLTVKTDSGCVSTKTKPHYINVSPRPIADFSWGPSDADIDNPAITFVNQAIGASTYTPTLTYGQYGVHYDLGDIYAYNPSSNYVDNNTSFNHVYDHYDTATYYVTQWVINSLGCKDSIEKPVKIGPNFTFYIPNAFSPNGDGTNEGFKGTGVGIKDGTYNLWVFDRWGNMIFYADELEKAWDGHMRGNEGKPMLQEDVYVWKVKFNDFTGKKHDFHGTVTLLK